METTDIGKDPYLKRNTGGTYDCTLCGSVVKDEPSYMIHTQGKRHQTELARRAYREKKKEEEAQSRALGRSGGAMAMMNAAAAAKKAALPKTIKIGRPGYRVPKQRHVPTGTPSLLFQLLYPDIEEGRQPLYRFMSAFEQKQIIPDASWQLLLFAAAPYETIAFKIPAREIFREVGTEHFFTHWDSEHNIFTLQLVFKPSKDDKKDKNGEDDVAAMELPAPVNESVVTVEDMDEE